MRGPMTRRSHKEVSIASSQELLAMTVESHTPSSSRSRALPRRLEGWPRSTCGHPSARREEQQAPQDDACLVTPLLRLVPPDAHQLLAEIGALQQSHERFGRAIEAFGDEFAVLDLA